MRNAMTILLATTATTVLAAGPPAESKPRTIHVSELSRTRIVGWLGRPLGEVEDITWSLEGLEGSLSGSSLSFSADGPGQAGKLVATKGELNAHARVRVPPAIPFAEDFEGFGITVVVLHTGRVFTLYSGLASTGVVAKDVVSSGQAVGRAASQLYFEVRVEDRPQDPLEWLR